MFSLQLTRAHYSSPCNRLLMYCSGIILILDFTVLFERCVPIMLHSMISRCEASTQCASAFDFIVASFVSMKMNKEEQTKTDHSLFVYTTRTRSHLHGAPIELPIFNRTKNNTFSPQAIPNIRMMIWLPYHTAMAHQANRFALAF